MPPSPKSGPTVGVGKITDVLPYLSADYRLLNPGGMQGKHTSVLTHRQLSGHLAPLSQPPPPQSEAPWCPGSR